MSKTAAITGGIGDAIYAIQLMRALGVTRLYVKENYYQSGEGSMYTALKPLLETQGIECLPTTGGLDFEIYEEGLKFDYDLDQWRRQRGRGRTHIIFSMLVQFRRFYQGWKRPWIKNLPTSDGDYTLIFLTWRWRENSKIDWLKVYQSLPKPVYFIGLKEDHDLFQKEWCNIDWKPTRDLLEMAQLIAGCRALYCGQGVALVIAQGLGKEYFCAFKPLKTNTMLYTANEHNLNNYREYEKV